MPTIRQDIKTAIALILLVVILAVIGTGCTGTYERESIIPFDAYTAYAGGETKLPATTVKATWNFLGNGEVNIVPIRGEDGVIVGFAHNNKADNTELGKELIRAWGVVMSVQSFYKFKAREAEIGGEITKAQFDQELREAVISNPQVYNPEELAVEWAPVL